MSGKRIVRYTSEELDKMQGQTDWERLRREEEDAPWDPEEDFEVDWSTMRIEPGTKQALTLRIDRDVVEFFRATGKGYQTRMNAVLRAYMEAARKAASG
jgi:uncharacterized protein (DUF4415 family)